MKLIYPFQFLFLLGVFLVSPQLSETSYAQSQGIGIQAGVGATSHLNNFRFRSGDINLDFSPNSATGFNIGLILRREIADNLRLQVEPSVIRFGARYEEGFELRGFNFQTESQTELLYFQLPIVLQISTQPPQQTVYGRQRAVTTYHALGGIYGGYLMDAKFTGTNTGAPIGIEFSGSFSNDVSNQYADYDAGLTIGVGLEHGHSNKIGIEARLLFSIIDSGNAPEISFKPQNMGALFSVYYIL